MNVNKVRFKMIMNHSPIVASYFSAFADKTTFAEETVAVILITRVSGMNLNIT